LPSQAAPDAPPNIAFKRGSSAALYRDGPQGDRPHAFARPRHDRRNPDRWAPWRPSPGPPQAAAAKAATILPGQWEYSYRIGPIPAGSESRCLKQADVEQFSKGICTRKYTCDYDTRVVQDGKVALKGPGPTRRAAWLR
jgi:hypothetical protein